MSKEYRSNDKINQMINDGDLSTNYGFKNYIINPGFDVWQRGTSFSSPVNIYSADRFRLASNVTGGVTVNKGSTAYGNNMSITNTNTSGQTYFTLQQRIEIEEYKKLNDKDITFSFFYYVRHRYF